MIARMYADHEAHNDDDGHWEVAAFTSRKGSSSTRSSAQTCGHAPRCAACWTGRGTSTSASWFQQATLCPSRTATSG